MTRDIIQEIEDYKTLLKKTSAFIQDIYDEVSPLGHYPLFVSLLEFKADIIKKIEQLEKEHDK
jgi:hypothetical protein